jgi:hypothetical protein
MLFAVWTENRATEEGDRSSLHSDGIHSISRTSTIMMPSTGIQLAGAARDDDATSIKLQLDVNEAQLEPGFEDRRPAVFKSTFWEVMCVASLVCGQLTNVYFPFYWTDCRNWLMLNKSLFPL